MKLRHVLTTVAIAVAVALTGCSGQGLSRGTVPRDISTQEKVMAVPCDEVVTVKITITDLAASSAPGKRNQLKDWSLDPDNQSQIEATQTALTERVKQCATPVSTASPSPTVTSTPSASPTASASASATPTATPTTTTPSPSPTASSSATPVTDEGYVSWKQVVADPQYAAGLKDPINTYQETMGFRTITFNWKQVQKWAKAKMKNGDEVDARLILIFQQPGISKAEARKQAHIDDSDVDAVYVTACTSVTGDNACESIGQGVLVILGPLSTKDGVAKGIAVRKLANGQILSSGVVQGTDQLVLYQASETGG